MDELYLTHRPTDFDQVQGQPAAVKTLTDLLRRKATPHMLLFSGPSGCGKTTLARIMRVKLGCRDDGFQEINAASSRGIDDIRSINRRMRLAPLGGGRCRVWLIDEAHRLTADAQAALLKMTEDVPRHVYFMFATTDPQKLVKTLRTRATEIAVKELSVHDLAGLVKTVADAEGTKLDPHVTDKLLTAADGSARKALVLLHQIAGLDDPDDQAAAIEAADVKTAAFKIAQALHNPRTRWPDMAKILAGVEDDPEGLRYMVLAYASKVALGGGKMTGRAIMVIEAFRDNFFDSKRAGLIAACYEVVGRGEQK